MNNRSGTRGDQPQPEDEREYAEHDERRVVADVSSRRNCLLELKNQLYYRVEPYYSQLANKPGGAIEIVAGEIF